MADSSSDEYCQEVFQTVTLLTQAFQDEVAQCRDDVDKQKELIVNFLKGSYSVADGGGLGKPRFPVRLSVTAGKGHQRSNLHDDMEYGTENSQVNFVDYFAL